jgi:hypothetical protein
MTKKRKADPAIGCAKIDSYFKKICNSPKQVFNNENALEGTGKPSNNLIKETQRKDEKVNQTARKPLGLKNTSDNGGLKRSEGLKIVSSDSLKDTIPVFEDEPIRKPFGSKSNSQIPVFNDENKENEENQTTRKPLETKAIGDNLSKETIVVFEDENNSEPIRRSLGLKSVGDNTGLKSCGLTAREPLKEKTTQLTPLKTTGIKVSTRSFNVLCDDDINKGVQQAPEPKRLEVYTHDELDTQHISESYSDSQRSFVLSSSEHHNDSQTSDKQANDTPRKRTDENEVYSPFEVYEDRQPSLFSSSSSPDINDGFFSEDELEGDLGEEEVDDSRYEFSVPKAPV